MNKKDNNQSINEIFSVATNCHKKKNLKAAEENYRKILKINPKHIEANYYLGMLYAQSKNFNLSEKFLNKTIEIKPDFIAALNNLGNVQKELGNYIKSINTYKKIIEINPNHSNSFYNLGIVHYEINDFENSKKYYLKTIQIQPNYAYAHYNLAKVYQETGDFDYAIKYYKESIRIEKNLIQAHNNLGLAYTEKGEFVKALASYNQAIKIDPNHANSYNNLGLAYTELGEFKKASNFYKKAAKIEPENLSHLYYLNIIKKKIIDLNLKKKIENIINNNISSKKNKAYGYFLLSRYQEKRKNFKKEFDLLIQGHKHFLESEGRKYKEALDYWLYKLPRIKEIKINKSLSNKTIHSTEEIRPIFVVGVPRCGSTLVEKIISSGKKTIIMGEETGILQSFFKKEDIINKEVLYNEDLNYFKKYLLSKFKNSNLLKDNLTFTDKSLENFFYIDLIHNIFPEAKIINCKRDVTFSIMSILKNNLAKMTWAHDLKSIFKYFDVYFDTINFFKKKYPNLIYELDLEKLLNSPTNESKKLMRFCNLEWSKKCLKFYKRKDFVSKTASNMQIRKPIFKNPINKYKPYKKFLESLGNKYHWYN